ncbi:MAG: hypothetical protein HY934_07875 [Candidatus Firestonebacteria bacterium]|nr:hypothetical protein [Candidatus Firestonebacteria bacterium]
MHTYIYAKQNFFAGEKFSSLREINENACTWLKKVNDRIHSTTKEMPSERLKRENLQTVAINKLYDLSTVKYRSVFNDCHFSYEANLYSVPYKYAGKEVSIKEKDGNIKVIYRNEIIAEHTLLTHDKGRYVTNPKHLEGLKELRCSHGIKKPNRKDAKSCVSTQTIDTVIIKNTKYQSIMQIENHDLTKYEELQ